MNNESMSSDAIGSGTAKRDCREFNLLDGGCCWRYGSQNLLKLKKENYMRCRLMDSVRALPKQITLTNLLRYANELAAYSW